MQRSEVILDESQKELLDAIAFIRTRKEKKRITRSGLIRECIKYWWENSGKNEFSDSDLILLNSTILDDIAAAKEDLKNSEEYTHEEMLRALKK